MQLEHTHHRAVRCSASTPVGAAAALNMLLLLPLTLLLLVLLLLLLPPLLLLLNMLLLLVRTTCPELCSGQRMCVVRTRTRTSLPMCCAATRRSGVMGCSCVADCLPPAWYSKAQRSNVHELGVEVCGCLWVLTRCYVCGRQQHIINNMCHSTQALLRQAGRQV